MPNKLEMIKHKQYSKTEIACYSLLFENIANRAITKMSRFKIYASIALTRDVRNDLLIVLYLDIHVGHDKKQYIPI